MKRLDQEKYVILTQLDPLYVYHFFNELISIIQKSDFWQEKQIIIFNLPNFNESLVSNFRRFYSLYGPLDTFKLCIKVAYQKFLNKRLSRISKSFLKQGIKIINLDSVKSSILIDTLSKGHTKVISISCPEILPKELLSHEKTEFFNIHCAPLPSYKGMMPNFWQRYHGELRTAVSMHEMEEKIDVGKVVHQISFPLSNSISLNESMIISKLFSAHLFHEYFSGEYRLEQSERISSYNKFPKRNDALIFKKKGGKFF